VVNFSLSFSEPDLKACDNLSNQFMVSAHKMTLYYISNIV